MNIRLEHITKTFGAFRALDDVTLDVRSGELVALLGPSGGGKTTLLRTIAGLEQPDDLPSSRVLFDGRDVAGLPVGQRNVGFVFQHYALFRHMSVFENVAFGLRVRPWRTRPSRRAIAQRVDQLLRLVQLDGFARRYPQQLSGGQRQRVALARALAVEPRVLLLDEPFGALDAKVRRELRAWLRRLHDEIHVTSVFVTHDQEEALELADRVVILNKGKIVQEGTPADVYERPASPFVVEFLGSVNLFHGRSEKPGVTYVRSHDIRLSRSPDAEHAMAATVRHVGQAGPVVRLQLDPADVGEGGDAKPIEAELSRERYAALRPAVGEKLFVGWDRERAFEDYSI